MGEVRGREHLDAAVKYIEERGIELYGVNTNPTQRFWTKSPKAYCHIYIDDAALGAPLHYPANGERPYIKWELAGALLIPMIEVGDV